ncbi:MAG: hypothetical protein H6782_01775 [Candidatus Nomurabacteria bacterium]|nr:MAG: hypothetical protein H6782_01775 [Candidatus Nomurabacteria bacterium]
MLELITWLYAGNGVIALLAYLPQIKKLVTENSRAVNFSILSWSMWTYSNLVAVLYAIFVVHDHLLTTVVSINLAGCTLVLSLVLFKNSKYK